MKLLLCVPPQRVDFGGTFARPAASPPLGILQIAACVRAGGWDGQIEIYDARLGGTCHRTADGHHLFGDPEDAVTARLRASEADIVGISNMFTSQVHQAYLMADLARMALPKATIILGGPHMTLFPFEALARPSVDWVVRGEGELRMVSLLEALKGGSVQASIEGVLRKGDTPSGDYTRMVPAGGIEPLDDLPLPAYDLVDMEAYFALASRGLSSRYREWGRRAMSVITSRGCPHLCVFCSIQTTMGRKYRSQSPAYVGRHLRHLVEVYGVDCIHFEDDNLTHDISRFDALLDVLCSFEPRLKWDTPNGVRADAWTPERLHRTRESGCQFLTLAVESAVPRVLNEVIRKRLDLAKVDETMRNARLEGLRLHAFYIIGVPGETIADMRATVDYALDRYLRQGVTPFLQPLIPIPGSTVHGQIQDKSLAAGALQMAYNQVRTSEFDPESVRRLFRSYLFRRLLIFSCRTLGSWKDFRYNSRLIWKYPQGVLHALRGAVRAGR